MRPINSRVIASAACLTRPIFTVVHLSIFQIYGEKRSSLLNSAYSYRIRKTWKCPYKAKLSLYFEAVLRCFARKTSLSLVGHSYKSLHKCSILEYSRHLPACLQLKHSNTVWSYHSVVCFPLPQIEQSSSSRRRRRSRSIIN